MERSFRLNLSPEILVAFLLVFNRKSLIWAMFLWEAGQQAKVHLLWLCCRPTSYPHRKSKSLSNTTDLKAVNWSLLLVSNGNWLQQKRNTASVERFLHRCRQVSWRELLRQVWSNNRFFVSHHCFSFLWDTICCENKMFQHKEETVKLHYFKCTSCVIYWLYPGCWNCM